VGVSDDVGDLEHNYQFCKHIGNHSVFEVIFYLNHFNPLSFRMMGIFFVFFEPFFAVFAF